MFELGGRRSVLLLCAALMMLMSSCTQRSKQRRDSMFVSLDADSTGITFNNQLDYSEQVNPYTFKSFYNGGGVGLGDFNNDGLLDVFFAGNMVSNKLYINHGHFRFEDVTTKAGLSTENVWSTGVSVADVNADGLLDIYVCKSGPPGGAHRKNELFINKGNLVFEESADQYGLSFEGLSVHAAFFDFDNDGDLDCYLLNNSIRSVGNYDLRINQRNVPDTLSGNKLLRNDDNRFVDVTGQSGIYSSAIGFGLGVAVGDINRDGWQDMFVSNDFFERDYLYINNADGTFREGLESAMPEISLGSMGADMADLNNDAFPEVYVTEMLPEHDARLKTTAQFETWDKFSQAQKAGYWRQFGRNVLQLNNGDGSFSEISRYAGVHATDWSWGALIFDMDNDGLKDIFVANGIYKDLVDQDYVTFVAEPGAIRDLMRKEKQVIKRLVDSIPSNRIPNYAFHNDGQMQFSNQAESWGLGEPSHSNGSAYGDLDNDGDLDLVLNNMNMIASVYENRSEQRTQNEHLSVTVKGTGKNPYALGSKVTVYDSGRIYYQEISPMRGFMSTVDTRLTFGIGRSRMLDSVVVNWPGGMRTTKTKVPSGAITIEAPASPIDLSVLPKEATPAKAKQNSALALATIPGVVHQHRENDYNDFNRDRLLFNMTSNEGPCFCKGDVNHDGREDFYVGGGKGQAGQLFIQLPGEKFLKVTAPVLAADSASEDTDCVFFDANGDGWQDLYVASGGSEFSQNSSELLSRLYFNHQGNWKKSPQALPSPHRFETSSTVSATDFDSDGDVDLFVGVRMLPFQYGLPASSYLLRNNGEGRFEDVTKSLAPMLEQIGLVTDSDWADINGDGRKDLVIVGEWMPIKVLVQTSGKFIDQSSTFGLDSTNGWYHALHVEDLNEDGVPDIVAGNHGLNSRFKSSRNEPVSMYVNDFDQNGTIEQVITRYDNGKSYPLVLRGDLVAQMPALKKKYLRYKNYSEKAMGDIFAADIVAKSIRYDAFAFSSQVCLSSNGSYHSQPLPWQAQLFPVYAIASDDFDGDGKKDLVIGGNLSRAKPETGTYNAGYGLLLKGTGTGQFVAVPGTSSGVRISGEIRQLLTLTVGRKNFIAVVRNNDTLEFLTY